MTVIQTIFSLSVHAFWKVIYAAFKPLQIVVSELVDEVIYVTPFLKASAVNSGDLGSQEIGAVLSIYPTGIMGWRKSLTSYTI
jgi:hypothetical protein